MPVVPGDGWLKLLLRARCTVGDGQLTLLGRGTAGEGLLLMMPGIRGGGMLGGGSAVGAAAGAATGAAAGDAAGDAAASVRGVRPDDDDERRAALASFAA